METRPRRYEGQSSRLIKSAAAAATSLCIAPHQWSFQSKIPRDKHVKFGLGFPA
jgi:hypothetical protein